MNQQVWAVCFFFFFAYIVLYLFRFISFTILALISFKFKNKFMKLYKYNFVIILILFAIDLVLYNTLDLLLHIDFFKTEGIIRYICLFSFVATYFPFWLVFATRNTFVVLKKWLEELKRMRKR